MPRLLIECGHSRVSNVFDINHIANIVRLINEQLLANLAGHKSTDSVPDIQLVEFTPDGLFKSHLPTPAIHTSKSGLQESNRYKTEFRGLTKRNGRPRWVSFVPRPLRPRKYRKKRPIPIDISLWYNRDCTKEKVEIMPGDILILADKTWLLDQSVVQAVASKVRKASGSVISLVYELTPITHPQDCFPFDVDFFTRWLALSHYYTDQYLVADNEVANELERWRENMVIHRKTPITILVKHTAEDAEGTTDPIAMLAQQPNCFAKTISHLITERS